MQMNKRPKFKRLHDRNYTIAFDSCTIYQVESLERVRITSFGRRIAMQNVAEYD